MKVVVLAGGLSPERNVSLSSGVMVCRALRERGHRAALVDMYMGTQGYGGTLEELFAAPLPEQLCAIGRQAPDLAALEASRDPGVRGLFGKDVLALCAMADAVFLALHGACGEDGRVQAALELLGIPYTGSGHLGSAIAMDKDLTKRLVEPLGVRTPPWESASYGREDIPALADRTRLPCVVKPLDSGSSIGVRVCTTRAELCAALEEGVALGGRSVIEAYIPGRELQVAVLGGRALPSIEIVPKGGFYDYENKYQPGAAQEFCPAPIPPETEAELAQAALTVFRALGLRVYARADFILAGDGSLYFLEINTLPGMTPTSLVPQEAAAAGLDYGQLCEQILRLSVDACRWDGR